MMQPISGMNPGMVRPSAPATGAEAPKRLPPSEDAPRERVPKPARDEYLPAEKPEPSGRYWLGKDGDGTPRIYFDDPEADAPAQPEAAPEEDPPRADKGAEGPEPRGSGEDEKCTANTDKVDREIKALKRRKQTLEQQLRREDDETRAEALKAELAQVETELRQKDTDAYRRQHTEVTYS